MRKKEKKRKREMIMKSRDVLEKRGEKQIDK